jgi:hypothetical protein
MANELYLVTTEPGLRMVICARDQITLGHEYPWCTCDDAKVRCIGVALPGEPAGILCVDDDVEYNDYPGQEVNRG